MAAPLGNTNGSKNKPWREAVEWAVEHYEIKGQVAKAQALRAIATVMVEQALLGDKDARKELADRLDGKAVQAISNDGETTFIVEIKR